MFPLPRKLQGLRSSVSENEVKDQLLAQRISRALSVRKGVRIVQEIKNKKIHICYGTKTYSSLFTVCPHDPSPQSHLRPGLKPPSTSLISDLSPLNFYTAFPTSWSRLLLLVIFFELLQQRTVWCIFNFSFLDGFWKRKGLSLKQRENGIVQKRFWFLFYFGEIKKNISKNKAINVF